MINISKPDDSIPQTPAFCKNIKQSDATYNIEAQLRGGAESQVSDDLRMIYLPQGAKVDLIIRLAQMPIPNKDERHSGKEIVAAAGPFVNKEFKTEGIYVQNGKRVDGSPVDYKNGLFKKGFFIYKDQRMMISDQENMLKGAITAYEGFMVVQNGQAQGTLQEYIGTTTGSKWHRRYLVEFYDGTIALIETINGKMTPANAMAGILCNAKSKIGAKVKNMIYMDMAISSAGKMWKANGDVIPLEVDKVENPNPAPYLLFHT